MTTYSFSSDPAGKVRTGVLVLPMFEDGEAGPGVTGPLAKSYAAAHLTGKKDENLLIPGASGVAADAILLVGCGRKSEFTVTAMRRALGRVAPQLARFGSAATTFPTVFGAKEAAAAVGAAVEGLILGAYRFTEYKTEKAKPVLKKAVVLGSARWAAKASSSAVKRAVIIAEAQCWARDLVNTPAGDMPPAKMASEAQKMAKSVGLTCKVWSDAQLVSGGFGGIVGVGKGSANPPRMIELTYTGAGKQAPIALTGKGIAFDSGGLSIKDAKSMENMKDDMGGAASILGTMRAIAQLKPKINVIAVMPCSENMPGGHAQHPGDVIRHRGGKTSEVLNTDAEGRLVLADSLAYLSEKKPQLIIDTATLTGACMVALGADVAGAFGNDDDLTREVVDAGNAVDEPVWHMPLYRDYRKLIDSHVADIKNIGERYGGAITAALFLAEFVGDIPWVHMDVAGPAFVERATPLAPRGGTGVPVRTLVKFVTDRAADGGR
ncbi:MAG: leucyl aminopeptidase [Actinomycetota bacterium]|nr:leucyl aminopeptidase [Actinomycetota bacterium]